MVTSSSYSSLPYSPAVAFLSNFVDVTAPRMAPDEEGEQVGDFIMGKIIGHGGFSLVREAFAIHLDGLVASVAVKIVKAQTGATDNDRIQRMLDKEIAIWSRLSHPNVLPFVAVEKLPSDTFVFCELCTGGNLLDYLTKQEASSYMSSRASGGTVGLDETHARLIFNQIAEAVRYLHEEKRIVHRDIKLENILQHEDGTWKICDFGLADGMDVEVEEEDDVVGGSLAYCSPEQLRSPKPLRCPSTDVWSLGVVLYALLTGRLPFQDEYEPRLQFQILNGRYEDPTECSAEARDLLKNMFKAKAGERLKIGQVIDHPWCINATLEGSSSSTASMTTSFGGFGGSNGFGGGSNGFGESNNSNNNGNHSDHAKMNNFFATFRF
ncbi:kinase-like domain-containing protein [Lobosporangium transversale]|uniref:Kinase-like domain-containing protein n=1 Tax=Lobosporangium transversale TaxID=64571 RepID=A0A1Y2GG43_9FUNG|nr:kinase-like domain-containing protein [Lobosporangium transversale]ORZ06598.1 kinase-like domain-containing protein [Lobosporangium transversale]|eukprot:XP_021877641.1 kinase-like domain-containing protein [Lobosporangium transversale]